MTRSASPIRWLSFALVAALAPLALADPLDDLVGAEQAKAMGLGKLSPAERDALAQWIAAHGAMPAPAPAALAPVAPAAVGATAPVPAAAAPAAAATAAPAIMERPSAKASIGTESSFGLEQDAVDGDVRVLTAKVLGDFTGWDGHTIFKLDNGQVWRQSTTGTYRFKAKDPEVTIEKGFLGYKLRLKETKRSIAVRRIK